VRYVLALDAALKLIGERREPNAGVRLLAPTLLRSQVLAHLYSSARHGNIDRAEARAQLDHMRGLNIRLLGDRVLQKFAWDMAEKLGWEDTLTAEYLALTRLQADALVTLDPAFSEIAATLVPVVCFEDMLNGSAPQPD
jgi:predicted nucleic acid-binding protein